MNKEIRQSIEIPDYGPYNDYPSHPMGGGNPYYCCSFCGITDPQINGTLSGHGENCEWVEKKKKELENK